MHRIENATAKENMTIEAKFFGGEIVHYDVKRLFEYWEQFRELERNQKLFYDIHVDVGGYGVSWNDDLDIDAETIWEDGILIEKVEKRDINHLLAYALADAREKSNLTQKQLAEKTGIYQAEISKIERGLGNPSLLTINRLADALDMEVKIDFISKNI